MRRRRGESGAVSINVESQESDAEQSKNRSDDSTGDDRSRSRAVMMGRWIFGRRSDILVGFDKSMPFSVVVIIFLSIVRRIVGIISISVSSERAHGHQGLEGDGIDLANIGGDRMR